MDHAHHRLKRARIGRGFKTATEYAKAINMGAGAYSHHERNGRGLGGKNLIRHSKELRVRYEWMESGELPVSSDPADDWIADINLTDDINDTSLANGSNEGYSVPEPQNAAGEATSMDDASIERIQDIIHDLLAKATELSAIARGMRERQKRARTNKKDHLPSNVHPLPVKPKS